jgi:hypothetical protein
MPPERGEEMTDTPPGLSRHPDTGHGARTQPPIRRSSEPPTFSFLPRLQHAPRGVDIQDLRPLRGRPYGPIPDTDAYPGAPTNPQKKLNPQERG